MMASPDGGGCACVLERAADALHGRRINPKPGSNLAHALCAPRFIQGVTDSLFQRRGYPGAAQLFALTTGPRKPGADSFLNHRALELGKYAHHLEHGLAGRRGRVEALLMQEQVDD